MAGYKFDYETKIWGGDKLRVNPFHFRASRLFWTLRELGKFKRGRLLDVGCGAGDFIEAFSYYLPKEVELFGVDISRLAVREAKKRELRAEFIVADAEKLPFSDAYFDVVTCFDIIEHVEKPALVFEEASRVLKKGGILQAFVPTENTVFLPEGLLIKLGWKAKEIFGGHPHHFSAREVRAWVEDAGFTIAKLRWGEHLVNQAIEITYFTVLSIRGKNTKYSVEGYLSRMKPGLARRALNLGKGLLAALSFTETMTFCWLPGLGLHITAYKK